jgi:hypothetical protein
MFMLIQEAVPTPRARVQIHVERAYDFDEKTGLFMRRQEEDDVEAFNLITDAGRVRLHTFCYDTASRTNGLNYVALSNDSGAPAAGDTALATELTADGLARAQGTVTLATGSGNQTTIQKIFTYLGATQAVQKTALFDAAGPPVAGVMAHEILFTQRTLFTNDTLTVTFTITLG